MRSFHNSALSPSHVVRFYFDFNQGIVEVKSTINGEGMPYDVSDISRSKLIELLNDMQIDFDVATLPRIKLAGYNFLSLFSAMKAMPCEEIKHGSTTELVFRLGKNQLCSLLSFVYMKWRIDRNIS